MSTGRTDHSFLDKYHMPENVYTMRQRVNITDADT